MEACLAPREVVLEFGLLPLQVLAPQLECVASVQAAHRALAQRAATGPDGNKYVDAATMSAVLDVPPQHCQLLLDTLAAVASGAPRTASDPPVAAASLHELSLFLMAQLYDREAHRPETQDHWPDPSSSGGSLDAVLKGSVSARAAQPGSPGAANNSRLLIKAQLQQLQRQHAAYVRSYADFLERHQRTLLELAMDDSSAAEAWQQQRAAALQQHKAAQAALQQQQGAQLAAQHAAAGLAQQAAVDSDMTPAEDEPAPAASQQGDDRMQSSPTRDGQEVSGPGAAQQQAAAAAAAARQQQPLRQSPEPQPALGSSPGAGSWAFMRQGGAAGAGSGPLPSGGSMMSSSSGGSGASLGRTSVPPVSLSAAEFDRLGFLLHMLPLGRPASAPAGGAPGPSSRSLFSDLSVGARGTDAAAPAAGPGSGGSRLSSFVPGFALGSSMLMEDLLSWMTASWLHSAQAQQQKAAAAAAAAAVAAAGGGAAPGALGPASTASPLAQHAALGGAAGEPDKQSHAPGASGVASLLADMTAASGGAGGVASWLGAGASPPNALLGSPAGPGLGSVVGGMNGLPVVTSVSSGGPSPITPPHGTLVAAAGGSGPSPAGSGGGSGGSGLVGAAALTAGTSPAGSSGGGSAGGAGSAAAAGGLGAGLSSIRVTTARGMVAVAGGSVDERGVCGVYRGTVVRGPSDTSGDSFSIQDCSEAHIYVLAPVRLARIANCSDCTVALGAVSTLLRVERCERLQLTAAAGQVLVVSCHSCCLHLGTPRPPVLVGDCRFVKLAPFNTRYETLLQHLAAAGIPVGAPSLWDQALTITAAAHGGGTSGGSKPSSGGGAGGAAGADSPAGSGGGAAALQQRRPGAATPSSPHTHGGSSSGERRGGNAAPKPVLLLPPEEFLPLVIPFRGTPGPLAGGAAHASSTHWLPGSHKQQTGPLPPLPFVLPPAYDAALQQQYGVVSELRARIRGSGLDEARRHQLQGVIQAYFREWLHSSGAIRQVYDLSKLEGDECGPSGGSPPSGLRDTSSL